MKAAARSRRHRQPKSFAWVSALVSSAVGAACLALTAAASAQTSPPAAQASPSKAKLAAVSAVDRHAADMIALSDKIWAFAETALKEHRSAAALADYAEKKGFKVQRGVSGMPTAFIATAGKGRPIIGIMGEYDALPGISQRAVATQSPLVEGGAGHGCGHNLFGPGSLAAALAIKELIESGALKGTIRFYGTPAEESVGGKTYMARDGLFDDVDVMLAWHPDDRTLADMTTSQAMMDIMVEFHGKAAHAALDPWNGRSAVDAVEAFVHGVNLMREHIKPSSRLHYTIVGGGDVPNVIPEKGSVWMWMRDWDRAEVEALYERVRKVAEGAAMMTETTAQVTLQTGSWNLLLNPTGARLLTQNLEWLGPVTYTEEEIAFAKKLQAETGVPQVGMDETIHPLEGQEPEGGSTDVADVSWVTPTLHVSVATAPKAVPWHAWPVVASSGTSLGHKGMIRAARTLAATMVDLYENPELLAQVRADFEKQTQGVKFKAWLPDGPPPVPKE